MSGLRELKYDSRVQMAEVVAGLLQGRTIQDITETLGLPKGRIRRWYAESQEFRDMLDEVSESVVDAIKAEAVLDTTERLQTLLPKAISVLEDAMNSQKVSERTTAAAHVMRFSGVGARKEAPGPRVSPEELIRGAHGPATGD